MNYSETLSYLYAQSPDFQNVGKKAYKPGLENTLRLDEYFGHLHRKFKSIHVAGTNGKGSTSHMLAAVLQTAGYRVGLYTSPHLVDFRERIKVNGEEISEQAVIDFTEKNRAVVERIRPSFFELTMMMAFDFFVQKNVDVAVVEVGLGGRLDSTNVITPVLSIITNIGLEHTDLLGDTLEKIATEKAGIIKPNVPVVVGEYQVEVAQVFERKAAECKAPITFANSIHCHCGLDPQSQNRGIAGQARNDNRKIYALDLHGDYQQKNLCTVLAALSVLREQNELSFSEKNIEDGLLHAAVLTGLRGRWQVVESNPTAVFDTGHNAHGLAQTMAQLRQILCRQLHIIFGMVADKDIDSAIALLPKNAVYYFTQAAIPRAMPADVLAEKCRAIGLQGEAFSSVALALAAAKKNAADNDFIYVGGSTFIVADALKVVESGE
ncbi:MAG: bifunctional folylpolyglutamate synthase/dihydrofolate synthase [Prevotellaceae bacterium]|nr:bifunctional folylpolyglutamate synthase/dihydrofolate synthase [Prevotellaceae bacterium]